MSSQPPSSPTVLDVGAGVGAMLHLVGSSTGGRLSIVEHPMAPGSLIEPHTHQLEDEYSFVLSGTLGMLLGEEEFEVSAGRFVAKPRGVMHAAWNARSEPARFLEVISPGGFEQLFPEAKRLFAGPVEPSADELQALADRYQIEFHIELVNDLIDRHGLSAAVRYN